MNTLAVALYAAGVVQLLLLIASALVPRVFDWRRHLGTLPPFLRTLFWVYGAFIVLVIIGFASITLLHARALAAGTPLARAISGFIAIFWGARLVVQIWAFDVRPFLTNHFLTIGYHGLTIAFVFLALVYAVAAFVPQML
jgi:hypothetical protein